MRLERPRRHRTRARSRRPRIGRHPGKGAGGGVAASSVHAASAGAPGALRVTVEGTSLVAETDSDGQFVLTGVGSGPITLRFEGAGVDARLTLSGLVGGQILTIRVHVAGSSAQLVSAPVAKPTQDMKFSGVIESVSGGRIVVAGRTVEDPGHTKCSKGDYKIQFGDLRVGDKVTVWGTLQPSGVVTSYEIVAEGPSKPKGDPPKPGQGMSFKGKVDSVSPLHVAGHKVHTDGGTRFKWSDGTALDPSKIVVGDQAYVEGTKQARRQRRGLQGHGRLPLTHRPGGLVESPRAGFVYVECDSNHALLTITVPPPLFRRSCPNADPRRPRRPRPRHARRRMQRRHRRARAAVRGFCGGRGRPGDGRQRRPRRLLPDRGEHGNNGARGRDLQRHHHRRRRQVSS